MKPQIKVLRGAYRGHTEVFSNKIVAIGRNAESDLQFHPDRDLEVSGRHAALLRKDDGWYISDVGSRNGTFVNGYRITTETKLDETDQIRFGDEGPVIEIRFVPDGTPDGIVAEGATATPPQPAGAPLRETSATDKPGVSTTQRIRIEVKRQTKKLVWLVGGLFAAVAVVASGLLYLRQRSEQEVVAIKALQEQVEGLATRLRTSQERVGQLRERLVTAQASGSTDEIEALTRQLTDATEQLRFHQLAAQVDYRRIVDHNQLATAMIYVEFGPAEVFTATAFAVRLDGTMLTNRHVVAGPDGNRRPTRIAIQFADSRQVWRGRILGISSEVDLAVVKVDIQGGVPAVMGLNSRPDTVVQGDPVALIGFPLGAELPMSGEFVKTTYWAGSVSKVLTDLIQINGYGTEGASGSPIFDSNGEVVAILYGGEPGTGGRILYSVPASHAIRLLEQVGG